MDTLQLQDAFQPYYAERPHTQDEKPATRARGRRCIRNKGAPRTLPVPIGSRDRRIGSGKALSGAVAI